MSAGAFGIAAIGAIRPSGLEEVAPPVLTPTPVQGPSFADFLTNGIDRVEAKVQQANDIANAFVLDDNIPVHQVTFALEEARVSLELAMQVRTRLTDAYQQLMGMQL